MRAFTYPYSTLVHAKRLARQYSRPYMIYVDHEEGQIVQVADYDDALDPDFLIDFDGEILAVVYPDGSIAV